ncbi:MAG: DUF1460 domain-containing protein [Calditrichaceae bacterium]
MLKNSRYIFILLAFIAGLNSVVLGQSGKKFHQMNHREIDAIIRQTSESTMTVTQKMNLLSEFFLGMPYNIKCVGDGPYALFEPWPLVNFKETNCMAFCEHVLALAISDSWDNFFNNLQKIRYRDGLIGMKTRNHYTMADWLPQNKWLLQDVSVKVGGKYTKKLTRTISHRRFFSGKGLTDMSDVEADSAVTIDYIPIEDLPLVQVNLKTGDIITLIYANLNNIFAEHMVLVAQKDNHKVIRVS